MAAVQFPWDPVSVTVHCKIILEFNEWLLQHLDFSSALRFSMVPDTQQWLTEPSGPGVWGSKQSTGAAHVTGSQWPRVVLSANTWFQFLNFIIQTGTFHWAWTNVLAVYSPSQWEVFKPAFTAWITIANREIPAYIWVNYFEHVHFENFNLTKSVNPYWRGLESMTTWYNEYGL
jgi:hypothetical protein